VAVPFWRKDPENSGLDLKLVIKISSRLFTAASTMRSLARGIAQLREDGHRITLVHGGSRLMQYALAQFKHSSNGHGELHAFEEEACRLSAMLVIGKLNKELVALLGSAHVPALGLCGADANMIRTRSNKDRRSAAESRPEVAEVDTGWLDIISRNGAVPVLAAITMDGDSKHCSLQGDQIASRCAIAWDADALIFVTDAEAPRNSDGSLMRWIEAGSIDALSKNSGVTCTMASKLNSCKRALEQGVRRTRILPASGAGDLASFYFSRIESGTEVVLAPRKLDRAVVNRLL
jgi:acetylglutamate kinase